MIGMRNVLVHEYLKVNRRLVYSVIKNDLDDLAKFIKAVSKFL
jgi:uncharacterized protein YutE (UPF0331/DUF86 family)